jgi:formylmethanofuran dehydrogenase subunit A
MALTRLAGGTLYDPANGIDGDIRDLWIRDGVVVAPSTEAADRTFDLSGTVVMPGGIDLHAHIAGPKVNVARKLRPEDRRNHPPHFATHLLRSGTRGSTPTTFVTGYLYAGMGYTTVFDAAIPPLGARHTHEEFHDTPVIDKGFFVLVGNNQYALEQIAKGETNRLRDFAGWLLNATGGYALKCVNPGGVESWKRGDEGLIGLDDLVSGYDLTPRTILQNLTRTADELHLPHPLHIHANRLGLPGNWRTTLDTMAALEGHRGHITHIQFHSYGGGPDDQSTFCSRVPELVDYVNRHPNLTVDVGQVMFGETTSMTGDGPLGHYLHRLTGRKWFNGETECEAGCGIVPIEYREKSVVHALQWAIGLEWYLLAADPWRIAMTTDHPNGAAFTAYPEIVALLMSRDYRREVLKRLPPSLIGRCVLPDLAREYSLFEIAIITRAAPAKMLGLKTKGHLGAGADADITVYTPQPDKRAMFELPRYVFKAGELIVEHGEIRRVPYGPTWRHRPTYDPAIELDLKNWFPDHYSIEFANFAVDERYFSRGHRE